MFSLWDFQLQQLFQTKAMAKTSSTIFLILDPY